MGSSLRRSPVRRCAPLQPGAGVIKVGTTSSANKATEKMKAGSSSSSNTWNIVSGSASVLVQQRDLILKVASKYVARGNSVHHMASVTIRIVPRWFSETQQAAVAVPFLKDTDRRGWLGYTVRRVSMLARCPWSCPVQSARRLFLTGHETCPGHVTGVGRDLTPGV